MVSAQQAIGIGVIVLFIAFAFPTFIGASNGSGLTAQVTLDGQGDTAEVEDALRIAVSNKTDTTADVNLTALQSGASADVTITETETVTVGLDGSDVTLTAVDITSGPNGDVVLEVSYPKDLAWSEGASSISRNLPIVFVAVALVIVTGLFLGVMRS